MRPLLTILLLLSTLLISACQSVPGTGQPADQAGLHPDDTARAALSTRERWQLLSLDDTSGSTAGAEAAGVLLETHLRERGIDLQEATAAAGRYAVEGSVSRWHYTGGAAPRPSIALALAVRERRSGAILWNDTVAAEGLRRESLSALADRLTASLVQRLPLTDEAAAPRQRVAMRTPQTPGTAESLNSLGQALLHDRTAGSLVAGLALKTERPALPADAVARGESMVGRSIAFYYAADPPVDVLSQFDRLVLEPDHVTATRLQALTARGATAYAYLSVGEVGPGRSYASDLDERWILGTNPAWNSDVLDLSSAGLRDFLLARVGRLRQAGYHGVFLDTLDSFNLIADTEAERARQQAGLVSLVEDMAARYPGMKIIGNRGFEVLDEIAGHLEAVAAESLYAGWNNTRQRYAVVPAEDRDWLLAKLAHARDVLELDVIAIDYLPPERRDEARRVAARIAAQGFIPWVATPALDYVGVGALEVQPRKVLLVHDSNVDGPLETGNVHRLMATPLEYLGYVPEYLDIATEALPAGELQGRYAGVVTWPSQPFSVPAAGPWLQNQLDDGVPVVFMGMPPVPLDRAMKRSLGIQSAPGMDVDSAQLVYSDAYIKPERTLSRRVQSLGLLATSDAPENAVHMTYEDRGGQRADVVVTGPFGGFAWQTGLVESGLDFDAYWVIDPFRFLRTALKLPSAPMPDVTSENGRRLWLAHIDGDALPSWAEMPGRQLGAEVIYDQILTRYPLPHTVSFVEGEMTEFAAYDDRRQRMFDIARKTARLPHVELASHTYSHPFDWAELGQLRLSGTHNLAIPGYAYSAERDIAGSIAFIDRELAPEGKRTKLMLWSGDALPRESDLAVVDRLGLPNMNGGHTFITRARPSLTMVGPMARTVGDHLQVYAPVMNENLYTHDWLGPFDGFKRVIETFEMTEKPRRLKPINVYYHFYSGTKRAAMKALTEVYDWSLAQDIYPLHATDYVRKVADFRTAGVARYLDGQWKITGLGGVRSLRLAGDRQWPELAGSQGVVGARPLHDGMYVHTDGSDQVLFDTVDTPPRRVYLVSSNGKVLKWQDDGQRLRFRISAEAPVTLELGGAIHRACRLAAEGHAIVGDTDRTGTVTYTFTTRDTGDVSLDCPA